jgi:hypothetical protein
MAINKFAFVTKFKSSSSDRYYKVKVNVVTGDLSCDCPGWTFKREGKARDCKHLRRLRTGVAA